MTDISRLGLEKIASNLGTAQASIANQLGDTNKNQGALLDLEAVLCKLRGSTLFYNDDYSRFYYPAPSNPSVIEAFDFVKFNSSDLVGLGIQGAVISKDNESSNLGFPALGGANWHPGYLGPPCPEGFGTWYYNAWAGYQKEPPSSGFENGNYEDRYGYVNPIRYNSSNQSYNRVPFFEHARWISILNSSGSSRTTGTYSFAINKDKIYGLKIKDHITGFPQDIRFMYYTKLVQGRTSTTWESINVTTNANYELNYLAYSVEEVEDTYVFKINIPNDLTYNPSVGSNGNGHVANKWWHFVMFWGTVDEKAFQDVIEFDGGLTEIDIFSNELIVWNVKHFFRDGLDSKLKWLQQSINDSAENNLKGTDYRYFVAQNRTHFSLEDGGTLVASNPDKYSLATTILGNNLSSINSISNDVIELDVDQFQSAILTAKTFGDNQGIGETDYKLTLGPKFYSDFATTNWEDFEYYPEPEVDYITIAKIILKRASSENYEAIESNVINGTKVDVINPLYGLNQTTIVQNAVIHWMQQVVPSHAVAPHGDPLLSSRLLTGMYKSVRNFRFHRTEDPIVVAAAKLLTYGSRTPEALFSTRTSVFNVDSQGSIIFRRLLKNPTDDLLQPLQDEPLAIQFDSDTRKTIESIASAAPSTEMLRLNADYLYLTNNKLNIANTFEVYLESSDNCTAADTSATGNRVGLDYTLRMYLEDSNENLLKKDWYIMASKYLLTNQEMADRITKEQSTVGYFTFDTLSNIEEWRLQGYAGIVPDLVMNESRVLTTRFASPPDSTQVTEAQFRANLEAQGYSQSEIDELVLRYLEDGNEFYSENLFQYDNNFVAIRETALNITTFTEGIPYWQSNIAGLYDVTQPDPESGTTFYSDSFTIALEGASASDLESIGKLAQTIYSYTPSSSITDLILENNRTGFAFNSGSGGSISEVSLKLKSDIFDAAETAITNNGRIYLKIYSSTGTQPDSLIASSIDYVDYTTVLESDYNAYRWKVSAQLLAGEDYWVVLELNSVPQSGDILVATSNPYDETVREIDFQAFSFISLADTNTFTCSIPIKFIQSSANTGENLTNTSGRLDFVIYSSTDSGSIGTPISITSMSGFNSYVNFSEILTYNKNFQFSVSFSVAKDTKYWVGLVPNVRPRGGTIVADMENAFLDQIQFTLQTSDVGQYTAWDNWEGSNYKAWMEVYYEVSEIYGYFNRDEDYSIQKWLPSSNKSRITTALLQKEGSWAFTAKKFPQPSAVYIYPRYSPGYYVPSYNNIYVSIRLMVGGKLTDYTVQIDPTTSPVEPIRVNPVGEEAESIAYLYVAKTLEELQNGTHGAPPGDRIIIRSS